MSVSALALPTGGRSPIVLVLKASIAEAETGWVRSNVTTRFAGYPHTVG